MLLTRTIPITFLFHRAQTTTATGVPRFRNLIAARKTKAPTPKKILTQNTFHPQKTKIIADVFLAATATAAAPYPRKFFHHANRAVISMGIFSQGG